MRQNVNDASHASWHSTTAILDADSSDVNQYSGGM